MANQVSMGPSLGGTLVPDVDEDQLASNACRPVCGSGCRARLTNVLTHGFSFLSRLVRRGPNEIAHDKRLPESLHPWH